MARSTLSILIFTLVSSSFVQSYYFFPTVHAKGQSYHVVRPETLKPGAVCSSPKAGITKRPSLTLSHRHGPCSPIPRQQRLTTDQILRQDQLRVDHIQARLSSKALNSSQLLQASEVRLPAGISVPLGTANFVVTVGLGTPRQDQIVVIDTGSELCWVQCRPCTCYPQQGQLYDPSQSSTYRPVACGSTTCGQLPFSGCSGSSCSYTYGYGDNSSTSGTYGLEALFLSTTDVFPDFAFGCGQSQTDGFGKISGIFGLGRGQSSLALQTSQKYGSVFSYCLPPLSSSTGYLALGPPDGGDATISYTPMITYTNAPYYGIQLVGISVGGQQLAISPSVFSSTSTILDSGTEISRLPTAAYAALREAFREAMSQFPAAPPYQLFDTCFNFSGLTTVSVPTIKLHLGGNVTLDVDPAGILVGSCLAFAGNQGSSTSVIGNVQQYRYEVVYDLGKERIGFRAEACS